MASGDRERELQRKGGADMQVAIVVLPVGEAPVLIQRSAHNLYSTHPLGC